LEKILSQDQINALLQAAKQSAKRASKSQRRTFTPFAFGQAARISKQQVQSLMQLHERFARSLKNRLSANLQASVEMSPISFEELPYSDVTVNIPEQNFLISLPILPTQSSAVLSMDISAVMSIVNLLLGGDGNPATDPRPLTEIEDGVMESVVETICAELSQAWRQVVELSFAPGQKMRHSELFRVMPASEKTLFLSFEVKVLDNSTTMSLTVPATAASLLLRKMKELTATSRMTKPEAVLQLQMRLQEATFPVDIQLLPTAIRGRDLLALRPGSTLVLQHAVKLPVLLRVAGHQLCTAFPVRLHRRRAALIQQKGGTSCENDKGTES
jgi:flagellar motor switch protein FliM